MVVNKAKVDPESFEEKKFKYLSESKNPFLKSKKVSGSCFSPVKLSGSNLSKVREFRNKTREDYSVKSLKNKWFKNKIPEELLRSKSKEKLGSISGDHK